ncbi:MAG: GPW/gp25 family protein [Bacteroidetes bacterium]|nr:GPW/gp25 family protein [Bacteroidota bacterium]
MDQNDSTTYTSFLGTGWSFPPEFLPAAGEVAMTSDEDDIQSSLKVLFGTSLGERFLHPKYGLDMRDLIFEPMATTTKTLLKDRIKTAILIYEPRINLVTLDIDTSNLNEGRVVLFLDYVVRSTNSRFNLVYPFNITDGNELRIALGTLRDWELHG